MLKQTEYENGILHTGRTIDTCPLDTSCSHWTDGLCTWPGCSDKRTIFKTTGLREVKPSTEPLC